VFEADQKIGNYAGNRRKFCNIAVTDTHLSRRYLNDKWRDKPELNSSAKAGQYAISLFAGKKL